MSEKHPNADRYIAIARACLQAINQSATEDSTRAEKIQAVYEAIDDAFQAELAEYRQSVAIMSTVLERIGSGALDAKAAASLASKTLAQQPESIREQMMH